MVCEACKNSGDKYNKRLNPSLKPPNKKTVFVPTPIYVNRYNICLKCDKMRDIMVIGKQCGECLCLIKPKCKLSATSCPLGKWPEYK